MKPEQERIRALVVDTISLLCRNGLSFDSELRVQAVVGITIDKDECFVVHVNKCFERKPEDEESCENEEQLKESLQQLTAKSNEPELASSVVLQPSREAPPSPVAESQLSMKKPSHSQDLSAPASKQQVSTRDNCTSMSDVHVAQSTSPKQKSFDDCSVPVESDECDDFSSEMSNSQLHKSRQPKRQKLRHGADAYRPKTKRRDPCEDLSDVEEDFCAQFDVGQQYMYVDSGPSRARPKAPKQQKPDVMFDPCCTPSMMGYGTQDVRLLVNQNIIIIVAKTPAVPNSRVRIRIMVS